MTTAKAGTCNTNLSIFECGQLRQLCSDLMQGSSYPSASTDFNKCACRIQNMIKHFVVHIAILTVKAEVPYVLASAMFGAI